MTIPDLEAMIASFDPTLPDSSFRVNEETVLREIRSIKARQGAILKHLLEVERFHGTVMERLDANHERNV